MVSGWVERPILEVLKPNGIKIGPFGSQLKKEMLLSDGIYKVYGQENVFDKDFSLGDRFLTRDHFNHLNSCEIVPGDFVMSTMGTIGKCAIVPKSIQRGIMDSHLIRLRFDEKKVNPKYILQVFSDEYHYLSDQTARLAVGGIMDGLSVGIVSRLNVMYPERFDEQERIISVLSDIDELIIDLKKRIRKQKDIRQGVTQQLLTGKKRINGFSSTWRTEQLSTVSSRIGVGLATSVTQYYRDEGRIIFRNLNIKENYLDDSDVLFLDNDFASKNPNKEIREGDVLTVHTGYVGVSCVVPEKYDGALTFTTLITTTKKKELLPEYLSYHLNSSLGHKVIEDLQTSGGRNNLNVADFEKYTLSFPSEIEEQKEIIDILKDMDCDIRRLEEKLLKYQKIKQGMMEELLTGKVRIV
ncbi:restriction endonuclease subunit S [Blautia obeum]|uniref:restriction endonuclease subunit S n=1 Tax=Blautia obeum TaxID=40520 RepID=UPI003CFCE8FA